MNKRVGYILIFLLMVSALFAQKRKKDDFLFRLLSKYPEHFSHILKNEGQYRVQIIYTQINRDKNRKPQFTNYNFNVKDTLYFYPASTVKLPVAILALQKLNELKIPGLDKYTTMITGSAGGRLTEVHNDPSAPDGRPTIAHYIKKILLVSDNDAYNRLYEFLGQEYINKTLHRMGFKEVSITHRLEVSLSDEENRTANPVYFYDTAGKLIYEKPAEKIKLTIPSKNIKLGKGFMKDGVLIHQPFDFSAKNRISLSSLHQIVKSILFPEFVEKEKRFLLTEEDYAFLRKYMSMMPFESRSPAYDPEVFWDTYVKFLFYGSEKNASLPYLRIFNKVGEAYGFLIDAAYFADFKNGVEFFLSAVIHCNEDGIYNDNQYDYDTVGFPFLKHLGRVIYDYELKRKKAHRPDLSVFQMNYSD
ncbi:MAG: class A beta-lactamase-related serine hydrolase [Chitinophagaceae bacterium]|nr:class A beta-lactamase-related serine hydrolase [Chitinophagaceae bacterium]